VKLTIYLHQVPRSVMVNLHVHSAIRLHGIRWTTYFYRLQVYMLVLRCSRSSETEKRKSTEVAQFSELIRIIRSHDKLPSVTSDITSLCLGMTCLS
jgi:hypothetical protein